MITLALCLLLQSDLAAGEPKKLAGHMKFTEGTVADGKGKIYYSDIPANLVFNGKTLFITARTGFYSVEMKVGGK